MEYISRSPEATQEAAKLLVEQLLAREHLPGTATVVSLSGELGAGKTVFVKGVARALGLTAEITSPTYVIEKIYDLNDGEAQGAGGEERAERMFDRLVHLDAYRLESADELAAIGWHELLTNPKHLVFIEWPEMVAAVLPWRTIEVAITPQDDASRRVSINETNI
ncbi:tRNA (adenosine(37)-N6)-threonylcarbamoyltransferase complex ATPase subunit type 1 TsaE [Patescibacteria group bacterium]|jgi:tRNA threonylcarbamoyladenosine biosynthesis protein TsaE|nr:tRNA (adenosine(37)-N6)-threonylcarbamoyltransferase complex ATPase subunit type 1 TsaE [Patescibacteria group bacterium]